MLKKVVPNVSTFVDTSILPHANAWDADGRISDQVVADMARLGYLGANVPIAFGGQELDSLGIYRLASELGRGCSSVRSLLTVHGMVCQSIARWGSKTLKQKWLPLLATGDAIGAFALSEPGAGSDVSAITTTAAARDGKFVLNGLKRWITFGQRADVSLMFAREEKGVTAFLVPMDAPGVQVRPMDGMFGTRASDVAEIELTDAVVDADCIVGRSGFGLAAVASSALELGRFTVASGCVGILNAALAEALDHARSRMSFNKRLIEHQLVAAQLARMSTDADAAAGLCERAAQLRDEKHRDAVRATWTAKYFASTAAFRAASDLVQIMGARGCENGATAQRLLRDAKVMEIIEGSTQLQEITIAQMLDTK